MVASMPAAAIIERSASKPMTACWWQWVCTSACPPTWGGSQPDWFRNSAKVCVAAAADAERGLSGSSAGASCRKAAVQLGSSPTIGVPAARAGARVASERSSTFFARFSWPVEIQVSPQHTDLSGSAT
jgi:hypothetical protein